MVLDNGEFWETEPFQDEIVDEFCSGVDEVWVIIPEGNAKTTLMSGYGLYHGDYTPTAEVLLAAASRDQAGLLFGQAAGFVERSPGFKERFRVFEGYRRIKCLRSGGRLQVFAADDRTGDGVIPTLGLIDEPHRARSLALVRTWRGKLSKRGGQLGLLSTAGEPGTEFEVARARSLADALEIEVDGFHTRAAGANSVLHDYSVPRDADVEDMNVVKQANPLAAITVEALAKKRSSPTMTDSHWRRFVCNQAVRGEDTAITAQEWAGRRSVDSIPVGEPIWLGADFGWKWDTTALVPLLFDDPERRLIGDDFAEILTPPRDGSSTPPEDLQSAFLRIHERNPVHTVVMDENAGGAQMAGWIESELGARVISHSQGHSAMALAYERFMEAIREGWLWHTGNPEFASHVLNAVAKMLPGGQVRFDRPATSRAASKQERRVWDALTAVSMVHSVAVAELATPETDFMFEVFA